jgi:5-methylcytosine-specific restriction endonuclease McrA
VSYDQKAYKKQYDLDHKEEKNEKGKSYYIANRETIKKKSRKHYEKNKEAIQAQRRAKVLSSLTSQAVRCAAVKRWQKRNPEKARIINTNAGKDRKARKLKQFVEHIDRAVVYEQHDGICGICEKPIVGKFHVDHIMPLAKGGLHCYTNVQVAHPKCNLSKKDKIL